MVIDPNGREEWSKKRKRCQNASGKRDFVTCAMMNVKHSVAHRPNVGDDQAEQRKKRAATIGPA